MDRKQFFKTCAGGLCACVAAASVNMAVAAEAPAPEDKRLAFVKKRYARFLDILSDKVDADTLDDCLRALGDYCASQRDDKMAKFRGDPDAYIASLQPNSPQTKVSYDKANGLIAMSFDTGGDCPCALNGVAYKTPATACACSLGWMTHSWEGVLGRKVAVTLKESVLRGDKACTFAIRVLNAPA